MVLFHAHLCFIAAHVAVDFRTNHRVRVICECEGHTGKWFSQMAPIFIYANAKLRIRRATATGTGSYRYIDIPHDA